MKKLNMALLCAVLFLAAAAATASAHPPKSVSLSWNPNGRLAVNVDHSVNDPQKHYINKIIVYVNDKIVAQKEYSSQSSDAGQSDTFELGALPGGTNIKAEAFCVIMGSASGTTTVP
jgi:desulfoferrodoxin (superoxide reductase-like protein)